MEGILIVRESFNDSKITKIPINDCISKTKLYNHNIIKDNLLDVINNSECGSLNIEGSNISRVDWENSVDFSREWVKIFLPSYTKSIIPIMENMGYIKSKCDTITMWFQQYLEGGIHPWHIHSDHFTGVYYLEYPKGCGKTLVKSPYNFKECEVDVVEGDMVVFPAHWIHQGDVNSKDRKTIISFNISVELLKGNLY